DLAEGLGGDLAMDDVLEHETRHAPHIAAGRERLEAHAIHETRHGSSREFGHVASSLVGRLGVAQVGLDGLEALVLRTSLELLPLTAGEPLDERGVDPYGLGDLEQGLAKLGGV